MFFTSCISMIDIISNEGVYEKVLEISTKMRYLHRGIYNCFFDRQWGVKLPFTSNREKIMVPDSEQMLPLGDMVRNIPLDLLYNYYKIYSSL